MNRRDFLSAVVVSALLPLKAKVQSATIDEYYGVLADSRENFIWYLREEKRYPVTVTMPKCGTVVVWPDEKSIPLKTTRCPCGAANHWLIKYETEQP